MESEQNVVLFSDEKPFRATRMWNGLVKDFKAGVRLKKKRWRLKYYHDCFSGSEALAWMHEYLKLNPNYGSNVTRTQAQQLCQKFLQQNVFEAVLPEPGCQTIKPVFEESRLYSYVKKKEVRRLKASHHDSKENERPTKSQSKTNTASTSKAPLSLKRKSSFSGIIQRRRKPFGERGLQNMAEERICNVKMSKKPFNTRNKQVSSEEVNPLIFENSIVKPLPVKSHHGHGQLHTCSKTGIKGMGGLSRKWKSDFDLSSIRNSESDIPSGASVTEVIGVTNCASNCEAVTLPETLRSNEPCSNESVELIRPSAKTSSESKSLQGEFNELWMEVCLERLQYALNVNSLEEILDFDSLSWVNVMENVKSDSRQVIESVPKWLVSAMKCLIHWPGNSADSLGTGPDYSGFENDVFKTICEYFQLIPEPLLPPCFLEVFTKISGLATKCKLSAIRALQYTLLLLKKDQKQQLQLLLRFMIKISKNHLLNLGNDLPTRELVIQTFVPCIFSGKKNPGLTEVLGIRITSFVMDNYCEVFKVPDGLQFEVEQQIAFHRQRGQDNVKRQGVLRSGAVAFCKRVTSQEYEEQKRLGTQRFLTDLLDSIVNDEKINEKERKKKIKQFQKTYPEIYFSRYPGDGLSMMSQQPVERLRQVMKPLGLMKDIGKS